LHRFLRFVDELEERGRDPGAAPAVSEAENVVRIMSIHRSKGLEFPVVVLPDLGKRFNLEDARRIMLFDRQRYIGLPVVDLEQGVRYPTLSSLAVADEIGRQIRAEELRILYVAMTRAREHLILIGSTKLDGVEHDRQRGRTDGSVPLMSLVGASTPLDWLVPVMTSMPKDQVGWLPGGQAKGKAKVKDGPLFVVHQHDADAISSWSSPERQSKSQETSLKRFAELAAVRDADRSDPEVRAVLQRITEPYPHAALGIVPAVVAASEMKRRFAADHELDERRPSLRLAAPTLPIPGFAAERKEDAAPLTPTERGTLMHLVLQHLDLTRPCDAQDVARQVDDMVTRGLLTDLERQALAFEPLAWFFTTDLGQRLLQAPDRVQREVPFVLGLPPDRIVPGVERLSSEGEIVLVRGMIDCLVQGDDADEVIDFKTDAITREGLEGRVEIYRPQINVYAEAVERIWGRPVAHRWLVFHAVPETVELS
jgi:ATP-dependent helicase/nuclease subunit A